MKKILIELYIKIGEAFFFDYIIFERVSSLSLGRFKL